MKLRFYAREGHCVSPPGPKTDFMRVRYIGREAIKRDEKKDFRSPDMYAAPAALKDPVECEDTSELGKKALEAMRGGLLCVPPDPPFLPADRETAARFGVGFSEVEWSDGEWREKVHRSAPEPAARRVPRSESKGADL